MLVITYVVSRAYDLPFRDADGILGGRIVLLLGTIGLFMAILGSYIIYRSAAPGYFAKNAETLSKLLAGVNTVVRVNGD